MDFKDKKLWIIGLLIIALGTNIFLQRVQARRYEKLIDAYDHNAINTYNYLMSKTDFSSSISEIEKLLDLEGIDDTALIGVSDAFTDIIDHLMQLNSLRGYSESDELLKEAKNKVRGFSYTYIYKEQDREYELINKIYLGFEDFLMDMYQNGIKEKDKTKIQDLITNLSQIEGTIKSSVNRNINPNDLMELRLEYKRIQPLLEKIEKILLG